MILRIKSVKYLHDFKLKLVFSDEEVKIVDFRNWLDEGGFYLEPLRNIEYFKKVQIDEFNYSICWPNGADFSPDILYEVGQKTIQATKKIPHTNKKASISMLRRTKKNIVAKS